MTRFWKAVLLTLLVAALSTPSVSAADLSRRETQASNPITAGFLSVWTSVKSFVLKAECGIDPDGRCTASAAPTSSLDAGCGLDPNGLFDPNGRCSSGS
jgi:hypothetical protein